MWLFTRGYCDLCLANSHESTATRGTHPWMARFYAEATVETRFGKRATWSLWVCWKSSKKTILITRLVCVAYKIQKKPLIWVKNANHFCAGHLCFCGESSMNSKFLPWDEPLKGDELVEVNGRRGWRGISAGIYKKRWKDPPFFSWENPLFLWEIHYFYGKIHYFYGKIHYFYMGKSTISWENPLFHGKIHYFYGHGFNSKLLNYQRLDFFWVWRWWFMGGFLRMQNLQSSP